MIKKILKILFILLIILSLIIYILINVITQIKLNKFQKMSYEAMVNYTLENNEQAKISIAIIKNGNTSGYNEFYPSIKTTVNQIKGENAFYDIDKERILEIVKKTNLENKDYEFEYSNFGISVLGLVLEKVNYILPKHMKI